MKLLKFIVHFQVQSIIKSASHDYIIYYVLKTLQSCSYYQ